MKKALLHINKKGFSLVEILVAVSVFLVFVLATTGVISSVFKNSRHVANKEKAVLLAEEAIEATRNLRDAASYFSMLPDGTYGLSTDNNQWNLYGTSDITDIFTRSINISTINGSQKKITTTISWADQNSQTNSIFINSYLSNWRAPLNIGLTMDKVVINHGGTKTVDDFLPTNLTTLVWDYSVDPPDQSSVNIPISFSPSTMTLGPGTYNFLTSNDSNYSVDLSPDCAGNTVILSDGDAKLCNITYEEYTVPSVTNPTHTLVAGTTATLGANVVSLGNPASISARGTCWGTDPAPITNCLDEGGTSSGVFTQARDGFTESNTYYYRGYATNIIGTGYSTDGTFTTTSNSVIPTVGNPVSTNITSNSATLGSTVESLGSPALISARGICYSTFADPSLTNGATCTNATLSQSVPDSFTINALSLSAGTTYHYRGYATNTAGTGYSNDSTFITKATSCSLAASLVGTPTTYDSNRTRSATINKPTGVSQGDIMFAHVLHDSNIDRLNSIPSGWVEIGRHKNGNSNQALFYKIASVGEGTNYTFGFSGNSSVSITISAYRGCFDANNPISTFSNTEYVVSNTTYRAAAMTQIYTNYTALMFPSLGSTVVGNFANPTTQGGGWIEDYDRGSTVSDFSSAGYRKFMTAAGVTGDIDSVGASGSITKHAFGVILKP